MDYSNTERIVLIEKLFSKFMDGLIPAINRAVDSGVDLVIRFEYGTEGGVPEGSKGES